MNATMENTIPAAALVAAAAAGLGKKARTMTITTDSGMTRATATDGAVWVDVIAPTGETAGEAGSIQPAPARGGCTADARLPGRGLRRIVAGIVPATDTESSRYALGGTLTEIAEGGMMIVIGTDGRRMHAGYLQPSSINGQATPIIPAAAWTATMAAVRSALKAAGIKAGKLDAAIDRGELRVVVGPHAPTGGEVVSIYWQDEGVEVGATALAVAGRFPRWRDCLPDAAVASYQQGPMRRLTVNVAAVTAAAAEFARLHRAEEKAGKAAHRAAVAERKARRQPAGPDYRIDRGIMVHAAGMIGRGVEWSAAVPACPVETILDQRYLIEAMDAAAVWGAREVTVAAADDLSAVTIGTGEYGEQLTAVIMPLVRE